jgi:hypothetical protein
MYVIASLNRLLIIVLKMGGNLGLALDGSEPKRHPHQHLAIVCFG